MTSKLIDMYLWEHPKFPKRDWRHIDVIDTEEADNVCQACGRNDVRHVHHLEHHNWEDIEVGCICAGKLIGDPDLARSLEQKSKNRAKRRSNWLQREWKCSQNGNSYIKFRLDNNRYHVVMTKTKYGSYGFIVTIETPRGEVYDASPYAEVNPIPCKFGETKYTNKHWYSTKNVAKLAAFDALF